MGDWIVAIIEAVYKFLWGDLITDPAAREEEHFLCHFL